MQGIHELGKISDSIYNQIANIVKNEQEFNKSLLYSAQNKEKILDENERKSFFKIIKNKNLFDCFQMILDNINRNNDFYNFHILKNDITFIKYEAGGFFKSHTDYLSITSNLLEEYTLILCLDANCKGGETKFDINPFFEYKSKATTTPKETLLFRKDLQHEGCLIEEGYKHILTANVIGVPKNCDRIIVITFDKEENKENKEKKRIIKYSDICNIGKNLILDNIKKCNKDKSKSNIIEYKDDISKWNDFDIIENIYNKYCISYDDYLKNKNLIETYIFEPKYIYCDKNLEQNQNNKKNISNFDFTKDIILCHDKENYLYCIDEIKKKGLKYTPFYVIYTEGYYLFQGFEYFWKENGEENSIDELKKHFGEDFELEEEDKNPEKNKFELNPLLTCFGENESILYYQSMRYEQTDKKDIYKNIKKNDNDDYSYINFNFQYNLKGHNSIYNTVSSRYFNLEESSCIEKNEENKYKDKYKDKDKLNVYDENSYSIIEKICKVKFYDYLEKNIKNLKLKFPQHKISKAQNLCNESIYENFNLIIVYGALKI
jgi:hypothetical protein